MDDKHERGAWEILLDSMATGDVSGAIMRQEKRGQDELNHSDLIPVECIGCTRAQLESLGFVFGDVADELFYKGSLPKGWKKVATDHSMHTEIQDEQGRVRGTIFYKAAFYDRKAHIALRCRYKRSVWPIGGYGDGYDPEAEREGAIFDCDEIIWRTERKAGPKDFKTQDSLEEEVIAKIEADYPDYRNPLAYWD
jgi:hypothetical protein